MAYPTTLKFNDIDTKSWDNGARNSMVTCLKQTTSTSMATTFSNIMITKTSFPQTFLH